MTQNRAAPGVYDPLETVLYFKYCITPHPLESLETVLDEINIKNMYPKMGYKKTMYPMYPKLGYNLGYKLGCIGKNLKT